MPFCPQCESEFRDGISICPDCDQELVGELASMAPAGDQENEPFLVVTEDLELARQVSAFYAEKGIPCKLIDEEEGVGILLPTGLAQNALRALLAGMEEVVLDRTDGEDYQPVLRWFSEAQDGDPQDLELLKQDPAELAGDLEALDRLALMAAKGGSADVLMKLLAVGELGWQRLLVLLRESGLSGDELLFRQILGLTSKSPLPGMEEVIGQLLEAEDGATLRLALHAVWTFRYTHLAPRVCDFLLHADPGVREEADEVLVEFTGSDLGFEPDFSPAELATIRERRLAQLEQ